MEDIVGLEDLVKIESNVSAMNRQIWGRMLADERVVVEIPKAKKRKRSEEDAEVILFEKKYMNFER